MNTRSLRWPVPPTELPPDMVEALARILGEALASQYRRDHADPMVQTRSGNRQTAESRSVPAANQEEKR